MGRTAITAAVTHCHCRCCLLNRGSLHHRWGSLRHYKGSLCCRCFYHHILLLWLLLPSLLLSPISVVVICCFRHHFCFPWCCGLGVTFSIACHCHCCSGHHLYHHLSLPLLPWMSPLPSCHICNTKNESQVFLCVLFFALPFFHNL